MKSTIVIVGWYLSGVAGSALLWWHEHREPQPPTRKAILGCALGGVLGLLILVPAPVVVLIDWLDRAGTGWWNKPVCRKHDDHA